MRLEIPDVPPSLNETRNLHWAAKARLRDKWILLVRAALPPKYLKPSGPMKGTVTLFHARLYDKDNRYGACKPLFDALRRWGLILDDSEAYFLVTVSEEKYPHKKRHTVIELEITQERAA